MSKNYYVYILTNKRNGTLYIGVTQDLLKRVYLHKKELLDGFTKKYNVKRLVYYEVYQDIKDAILREKGLKKWKREWKIKLIEEKNPSWEDLYYKLTK
jgi:putative endonuclease